METHQHGLMPTCREVQRLLSDSMDRPLPLGQRSRMRVHLLMCGACTRFRAQLTLLRQAMRSFPPESQP